MLPQSEKDAKLAQKLGQLQPSIVVFPQECMHGPTGIFRVNPRMEHLFVSGT